MALTINDNCTACDACPSVCPNEAISVASPIYIIDPAKCTECVGFHDEEACAAVCPVDCCIPDPNRPETEEQNYAKLAKLHADKQFPPLADLPAGLSRYRN